MCSTKAVVVLVEVHHLEAVELSRDLLDLLGFIIGDGLNAWCIPERSQ